MKAILIACIFLSIDSVTSSCTAWANETGYKCSNANIQSGRFNENVTHLFMIDCTIEPDVLPNLLHLESLTAINTDIRFVDDTFHKLKYIRKLEIKGKTTISEIKATTFNRNIYLLSLTLNNVKLRDINPYAFEKTSRLGVLDLSNNNIGNISVISDLQSLRKLVLEYNKISKLDNNIFNNMNQLDSLSLKGNKISSIGNKVFQHLPSLKFLNLNDNDISTLHKNMFLGTLDIKNLYLSSNKITIMPSVNFFISLKKLEYFGMSGNKLLSIPPDTFQHLKNLVYINFSYNKLTSIILRGHTKLVHAILDYNRLHTLDMREFADSTSLATIRVRNNSIHTIIRSNITFKELRELNLCKNNITFLEMNAFSNLVGLKKLLLCQNSILYWNQNLNNVFQLEELDISGNNMKGFKFDMLPKSVVNVLADNNNYDCNCQLQDEIKKYLLRSRRQNITGVCSIPMHLRSLQLDTLPLKEPCMNNFTCHKDTSKSYCKCGIEYKGEYCEEKYNPCSKNPCNNHGTCYVTNHKLKCKCMLGFSGARCEYLQTTATTTQTGTESGRTKVTPTKTFSTLYIVLIVVAAITLLIIAASVIYIVKVKGINKNRKETVPPPNTLTNENQLLSVDPDTPQDYLRHHDNIDCMSTISV